MKVLLVTLLCAGAVVFGLLYIQSASVLYFNPLASTGTTTKNENVAREVVPSPGTSESVKMESAKPEKVKDVVSNTRSGLRTGMTWQIQFASAPKAGEIITEMVDLDCEGTDAATVTELKNKGVYVVGYIDVGSWEEWRNDAADFPAIVRGAAYEGWPGEEWLDVRRIDVLAPILRKRIAMCAEKGFNGIDPDNINGFENPTGFPLTAKDQLAFNIWLAQEIHAHGMQIGLKNDTDQVAELFPYYDFAVTESCAKENWCDRYSPFVNASKPVFSIEYTEAMTESEFAATCSVWKPKGYSLVLKHRNLDSWSRSCN